MEIGVRSVFEHPTVEGLAGRIEAMLRTVEKDDAPPLIRVSRGQRLPLSFSQQRLWFIEQLDPGNAVYNIPGAVRLAGRLDLGALESVVNEIIRRHEVLRTRFEAEEDEPAQVIEEWEWRSLEVTDLADLTVEAREEAVNRIAGEEAGTGFDLSRGPLIRVKVLRLGQEEHVVLFTMHHIVSDGWSMGVLIKEVGALYQAYSMGVAGAVSPLEELRIQYADFAVWQRGWLQGEVLENQLNYWRRRLGGELPALKLPTDRPRPAMQTHRGAQLTHMLPTALSNSLKALSLRHGCTLFMTLLAAFKTLLYYLTGQTDIAIGTDIANRNRAETERLIGFFVNQLVLRTELSPDFTFDELLRRVRKIALEAYAHQDLPFEKLVESLNPDRLGSHSPLFQAKMALQNTPIEELVLAGLTISPVTVMTDTAKFDLLLNLEETRDGLSAALQYNTDLFDDSTSARILDRYHTLLNLIVERPETRLRDLVESLLEEDKHERLEEKSRLKNLRQRKLKNIKRKVIGETYGESEK
jgi:hypothetical protein